MQKRVLLLEPLLPSIQGVHYEMDVTALGHEWLVHSTDLAPVGSEVGIWIDPYNIHIMSKPESEDEEAIEIEDSN